MAKKASVNHIARFDQYYAKMSGKFWLDGVNDYWIKFAYFERNKRIVDIVNQIVSDNILDIGCGTGDLALLLKHESRTIVGVEPSKVNAEKFRNNTGMQCYEDMAESLRFNDKVFDVVVMADVLEHVIDPFKALQEALRVLQPSGYLIFTTPNKVSDMLWSIGSKNIFNIKPVKDDLFTIKRLKKLYKRLDGCELVSHAVIGVYPRSKILSKLLKPKYVFTRIILNTCREFECLRYRQIVILRKYGEL